MKDLVLWIEKRFEKFTEKTSVLLGSVLTFVIAVIIVICWITLDIIHSASWHILINDYIFSFTFLMIFILQKMQNKFSTVLNIKLNELVASQENASNRLIKAEDLSEDELRKLAAFYQTLSATLEKNNSRIGSGSIEHVIDDAAIEEVQK